MKMSETATNTLLTFEDWQKDFLPISNPRDPKVDDRFGDKMFHQRLDYSFIEQQNTEYVWTLVEADGLLIICPGLHHINREGYFVCEKPHNPETPEVEYWGHDDELEKIMDSFDDQIVIKSIDESVEITDTYIEETDTYPVDQVKGTFNFTVSGISFVGMMNTKADKAEIRGVLKSGKMSKKISASILQG